MVIVDCIDLAAEVEFFTRHCGFRVRMVTPADDPRTVVLERDALGLEIRRSTVERPVRLRIEAADTAFADVVLSDGGDSEIESPGGSVVTFSDPRSDRLRIPENRPSLTVVASEAGSFGVGRAGMEYRDLLPDRWGGRFIASHIRMSDGGDVADWVHFHQIRFQMIFVAAGWVDVVYEDQGEPFRMNAGDCVLQPPEIRHRVLRSSPGVEVIEVGCPAEHDTRADHGLILPTGQVDVDRDFGGQRFVRHVADGARTEPWVDPTLVVRDTGIGIATDGLAGVVVVSPDVSDHGTNGTAGVDDEPGAELTHDGEFVLVVGLAGSAVLDMGETRIPLDVRTSVAIPAGTRWRVADTTDDHSALVVSLPAGAVRRA